MLAGTPPIVTPDSLAACCPCGAVAPALLLQPWQYEKYVQQAWAAGYRVREEVVGEFTAEAVALYAQRNVHGVPLDKIHIMLDQWQRQ